MDRITVEMLEASEASGRAIAAFKREWTEGAAVTVENARRMIELGLRAEQWMSPTARLAYYKAVAAAHTAARRAYEEARAAAWVQGFLDSPAPTCSHLPSIAW